MSKIQDIIKYWEKTHYSCCNPDRFSKEEIDIAHDILIKRIDVNNVKCNGFILHLKLLITKNGGDHSILFNQLISLKHDKWSLFTVGAVYKEMGEYDKAEEFLKKALDKGSPLVYKDLSLLYYNNLDRKNEAIDLYERYMKFISDGDIITFEGFSYNQEIYDQVKNRERYKTYKSYKKISDILYERIINNDIGNIILEYY